MIIKPFSIAGAFGSEWSGPVDGETLVFRADGKGATAVAGRLRIEEWSRLANRQP
jgi:hypothetical protein